MAGRDITSQFNEIYDSTYKAVLSYITARCKNAADIGDIAQETYMELYGLLCKRGADYVRNGHAITLKIAKRKLYRHYTLAEKLRRFVPLTVTDERGDEVSLADLEAEEESASMEEMVVNQIMLEEARRFLRQKPDDVKKVFNLYYDAELTIAEIAQALQMSESNVKHKLYRTLKELRELFR
ncbi:MAG: sigma-70 family RNA polymerase sigma factor [Oscillospiraceae bacterium]|nr:sigma-70 family RNA polymerase sigma factor [Oscillospiraceae bacterium]